MRFRVAPEMQLSVALMIVWYAHDVGSLCGVSRSAVEMQLGVTNGLMCIQPAYEGCGVLGRADWIVIRF